MPDILTVQFPALPRHSLRAAGRCGEPLTGTSVLPREHHVAIRMVPCHMGGTAHGVLGNPQPVPCRGPGRDECAGEGPQVLPSRASRVQTPVTTTVCLGAWLPGRLRAEAARPARPVRLTLTSDTSTLST